MNRKKVLPTAFILAFLLLAIIRLGVANPIPVAPLRMPEEHINITISLVNETLWAKVDGTYPLYKFSTGDQDPRIVINNTEVAFVGDTQQTFYPIPPDATKISVRMDEAELNWINFTKTYPETKAVHHTFIGDWPYIYWTVNPVPDFFTIKARYEHPISVKDGNFKFLYDLNTVGYLSPWGNVSTAYFSIRMEVNCSNLHVYAVDSNGTMHPIDYSITKENAAQVLSFKIVSEYSKPLLGDVVIALTDPASLVQQNGFLGTSLPVEYGYGIIALMVGAIATTSGYMYLKRKK